MLCYTKSAGTTYDLQYNALLTEYKCEMTDNRDDNLGYRLKNGQVGTMQRKHDEGEITSENKMFFGY